MLPGFPGLFGPGLIEAGRTGAQRERQGGFPGLFGPGLIEAYSPATLRYAHLLVFRGYSAPASLKLIIVEEIRIAYLVFRGYSAPASLKHHGKVNLRNPRRRFPGLFGPGLIEAIVAGNRTRKSFPVFRGYSAPASLKHILQRFTVFLHRRFPGLFGPGLIEAGTLAENWRSCAVVFRGYSAPASLKQRMIYWSAQLLVTQVSDLT